MWLGLEKLVRGMFKRLHRCTSNRRYEPCGKKAVCYSTLHFTTFFSWGGSNEAKKKISALRAASHVATTRPYKGGDFSRF